MKKFAILSLIIFHSSLFILTRAQQTLPTGCLDAYRAAALHWHNMYREMHQNTPNLSEDPALNTRAQAWANRIAQIQVQTNNYNFPNPDANQPDIGLAIGQNSWQNRVGGVGIQSIADCTKIATDSTSSLYAEIKLYNYNNPVFSQETGHFTQLVWKSSTTLGMGLSWWRLPDPNQAGSFLNWYLIIYYYSPAGNSGFGCTTNPACNFPTNVMPLIITTNIQNMPTTTTTVSSTRSTPSSSTSYRISSSSSPSTPSTSSSSTCQNLPGYDLACNYFVKAGFNYCTNQYAYIGGSPFMTACVKSCGFCSGNLG